MVDPYDISVAGWPPGHPNRSAAEHILKQHNPNKVRSTLAGGGCLTGATYLAGPLLGPQLLCWHAREIETLCCLQRWYGVPFGRCPCLVCVCVCVLMRNGDCSAWR